MSRKQADPRKAQRPAPTIQPPTGEPEGDPVSQSSSEAATPRATKRRPPTLTRVSESATLVGGAAPQTGAVPGRYSISADKAAASTHPGLAPVPTNDGAPKRKRRRRRGLGSRLRHRLINEQLVDAMQRRVTQENLETTRALAKPTEPEPAHRDATTRRIKRPAAQRSQTREERRAAARAVAEATGGLDPSIHGHPKISAPKAEAKPRRSMGVSRNPAIAAPARPAAVGRKSTPSSRQDKAASREVLDLYAQALREIGRKKKR